MEKCINRNGAETIVDDNGILWLNEKHIEEGLDQKLCKKLQVNIIQNIEDKLGNKSKNSSIKFLYITQL